MHSLPEDILGKIVSYVAEGETKEQTFPESVLSVAMKLRDDYIREMINDLPCVVEIINTINENIELPKYYFGCDKHHVLGYDKWVQNDYLDFEDFHEEFARTKDRLHSLRLYSLVENLVANRQTNTRVITRLVLGYETGYKVGIMWPSAAVSVSFEESLDYDPPSYISLFRGIRWRKYIPGGCLVVFCKKDPEDFAGGYTLFVDCTSTKGDVPVAELLSKYGDDLICFIEMVLLLNTGGNPEWSIQATDGIKALIKQNEVSAFKNFPSFGGGGKTKTKKERPVVVPEPSYSIPITLLGGAAVSHVAFSNDVLAGLCGVLGAFLAFQASRVRFVFDDEALEVVIGAQETENAFVGGKNRWTYDSFVNWEFWWPGFPVLVYFKETQTKPEGQIHFFPLIFNGKQVYDVMVERCGPSQGSSPKN